MSDARGGLSCSAGCWLMAAAAGLVALIMMLFFGTVSFIGALFLSGVIFVALGLLFGFLFCRDLPAPPGRAEATASRTAESEAPEAPPPGPEAAPEPAAPEPATPEPATPEPAAPRSQASAAPSVRSGTQLPGQEELASRKGKWRYQGAAPAPVSAPVAQPATAAQPAPAATEGRKPEGLSAPRDGAPDNLKEIRGIGPRLQKLLNSMGYFHFDQIAAWGSDEIAWVDENLPGFKGRVSRDDWVGQARTLAGGGTTEFSGRVRDGDVY